MKKSGTILVLLICLVLHLQSQLICFDFPAEVFSTPGFPTSITAADFNGDKIDDLAICHYDGEFITIMMNDGNGKFPGIITYPIDWSYNLGKIIAEDLNDDNILDLILYGMFYDIYIFTGTGFGNFSLTEEYWTDYWSSDGVTGYFDENSEIDLALINQNQHKLRILSGTSSGSFQDTYTYSTMGTVPRKMAKGDFNEDGHTDLVVCNMGMENQTGYNVVLFKGTGQGSFQSGVIINDDYIPESVVTGDYNLDGHTDIIFKRYDRWLIKLWGKGDGTFQEPEIQEISAIYYTIFLHDVDINLDGYSDLAMSNFNFNMHINDGSGNFEDTLFIEEKSNYHRISELVTGTFNADSKPDVISIHHDIDDFSYGSLSVFLNCLPVGVPDTESMDDKIKLYPSPGNGYLRISTGMPANDVQVTGIFNCLGMAIDESRYSTSGQYLDLTSLDPGLYIIRFIIMGKSINRKVIIN